MMRPRVFSGMLKREPTDWTAYRTDAEFGADASYCVQRFHSP